MKKNLLYTSLLILLAGCTQQQDTVRERIFSDGWKFVRDSIAGAEAADFNDNEWITVDLPHDFSLMELPGGDTEEQIGPFSKQSEGVDATGHVKGGTGWYRKTFTTAKADEGKTFTLVIGGAYMESYVWVNGQPVGENHHGYTSFAMDITQALRPAGEKNVIAVRVDNIGKNSRWYSGSGLYRDVKLIVTEPLHVDTWGAFITTPEVSSESATAAVQVTLQNDGQDTEATVTIDIADSDGTVVASAQAAVQAAADKTVIRKDITLPAPKLWSVDSPYLYKALITVKQGDRVTDTYTQAFGVRTVEITADKGFLLNGKPLLLKGGCMHHDNGFLGAAAIRRAEYHRVEMMKEHGYNAIRCSHNPPSEYFLDACDELGIVVIDEFCDQWTIHKNTNDYAGFFKEHWEKDLTNMITRDRNHPCIVLWSIGNEIPKHSYEEGAAIGQMLKDKVYALDGTRKVTEGITNFLIQGGMKMSYHYMNVLDVVGYNYAERFYAQHHKDFPERIMFASESYPGAIYEHWKSVEEKPYVIGDFVWTALDYIGEVSIGFARYMEKKIEINWQDYDGLPAGVTAEMIFPVLNARASSSWPNYISWCGDLDIIGERKPQAYYRDVIWDESIIEMNVHEPMPEGLEEMVSPWGWPQEYHSWNWAGNEGKTLQVRVFTKAPQVRLELNGETVGEKTLTEADKYIASFDVPYQAGILTAVALKDGQEVARKSLTTAGKAQKLTLTVDRSELNACRGDLAFIRIDAVDENGQTAPVSDITVSISVSGDGQLAASGSACPNDMASVNRPAVKLYRGQAQAIVRPFAKPGKISVSVSADGFDTASTIITVK